MTDDPNIAPTNNSSAAERRSKQAELRALRDRVAELERDLAESSPAAWQASGYYTAYYATAGFVLGMLAALTSLVFNVIGSAVVDQHPLRLIQIYLTFPLGEAALELDGGLALTLGCCLYIATGMVLGVPFFLILTRIPGTANSLVFRLAVASVLALSMWAVHYYAILEWLQPLLFGGNWIVDLVPGWIGAATHLVYGWTLAAVAPWGRYVPYRRQTEQPVEAA